MNNDKSIAHLLNDEQAALTLKWVRDMKQGFIPFEKSHNWLLISETASDDAYRLKSLTWAYVAIEIYEWADLKIALGWGKDAYISKAMEVRMEMISHFGPDFQNDVLNPDRISELFLSYANISIEEAIDISRKWREAEKTKVNRRANRIAAERVWLIRSRLDVLKTFKNKGFSISPEAERWLSVEGSL